MAVLGGTGRRTPAWAGRRRAAAAFWLWGSVPVVVGCWEAITRRLGSVYFPPPSQIAGRIHELWLSGPAQHLFLTPQAAADIVPSLARLAVGWSIAALAGIAAGLVLGRSVMLSGYAEPLLRLGRATPPAALVPLFITMFGLGAGAQVATIVSGTIWPVLVNTADGARSIDALHLQTATVYRLSRPVRLARVVVPTAAPQIAAGLRQSLPIGLILMVVSEMAGGTDGIGYRLAYAQQSFDLTAMWAALVVLGGLGCAANTVLLLAEHRLLRWHRHWRHTPR